MEDIPIRFGGRGISAQLNDSWLDLVELEPVGVEFEFLDVQSVSNLPA